MINVTIYRDSNAQYKGFKLTGHAGYARCGRDVVCSAVSVLTINAVNSIEKFTDDSFEIETEEDSGLMKVIFKEELSHDSQVLMDSMVLGLRSIKADYGKYLKIIFKEV